MQHYVNIFDFQGYPAIYVSKVNFQMRNVYNVVESFKRFCCKIFVIYETPTITYFFNDVICLVNTIHYRKMKYFFS